MKSIVLAVVAFVLTATIALPAAAATYEADENGRFFVVATVNGTPIRFHLDTGADRVVLSLKDALQAGITLSQIEALGRASIAGGGSITTLRTTVREIRLDQFVVRDVETSIVDDGDALLGLSFLRRLPGFRISGRMLTIDDGPQVAALSPPSNRSQTKPPAPTKPPMPLGNGLAAYQVGWEYATGQRGAQNHAEAARWFREAAEQGYAPAQTSLGWLYERGQGVARDYSEAARWFRKAAEQGYAPAQTSLGWLYVNGWGVAQDHAEAARWNRKAAEARR